MNLQEALNVILSEIKTAEFAKLTLVTQNGEVVTLADIDRHNYHANFQMKVYNTDVESAKQLSYTLHDNLQEALRNFNSVDFDKEWSKSIHPDYSPDWEENLEKLPVPKSKTEVVWSERIELLPDETIKALQAQAESKSYETIFEYLKQK